MNTTIPSLVMTEETRTNNDDGINIDNNNNNRNDIPKSLHIAPMLDVTTREFRQLMRILSKRCVLWTEMVVDETIVHTQELDYHLGYEKKSSHPIVCQLGGSNTNTIRPAVKTILDYGYDEVNINMDCPSNRVAGLRQFGAILMKQMETAEQVVQAMKEAANGQKPISVKCRVGVDELDDIECISTFIDRLSKHCKIFYLHARKCVLGGLLTPAQNRCVPPLNYPRVYEICRRFPGCDFYINGGISDLKAARELCYGREAQGTQEVPSKNLAVDNSNIGGHTVPCYICKYPNGSCVAPLNTPPRNLKGCQLGKTARDNPCLLWDVDRYFYGEHHNPCQNRRQVLEQYCDYLSMVYPRRCCDFDPCITSKIPAPEVEMQYSSCPHCAEFFNGPESIAPPQFVEQPKITNHVLNRSIRPLWGILYGQPKARAFRRECDRLILREPQLRNCGPAALIQRALKLVPEAVLDQHFIKTEDLQSTNSHNQD
jgi:tRNA-dihydrouridine synthase A